MSSKSTIQTLGERVIPADQRPQFMRLLEQDDLHAAAKVVQKWIPDAVRNKRVEGSEEALYLALDSAQAITSPVAHV